MDDQQFKESTRTTQHIYENLIEEIARAVKKGLQLGGKTNEYVENYPPKTDGDDLSVSRGADVQPKLEFTAGDLVSVFKEAEIQPEIEISLVKADNTDELKAVAQSNTQSNTQSEVEKNTDLQNSLPSKEKSSTNNDESAEIAKGLLFKNSGINKVDRLTKEDAAAIAKMLQGNAGDKIPGAANLKIVVNGEVIAQADAEGNLTTANPSPKLAKSFTAMSKEAQRPSKSEGVQQVASIASQSQAPGHQFMRGLVRNYEAQFSPDMPVVANRKGLTNTDMSDVDSIINLYATREKGAENYELKDGGTIIARAGTGDQKDYQFFEVQDATGNIDMGFSVSPDGMILAAPKVSVKLQEQITLMEVAWDKGEYNDDTPLMSKDKARAEALGTFTQNVATGGENSNSRSDLSLDIKTDKTGKITATSKSDPKAKVVMSPNASGRMRVLSNNLSTQDLQEFNHAFAVQTREKGQTETGQVKEEKTTTTAAKKKAVVKKVPAKRKSRGMAQ
jgi:hypothetical protein